MTLKDLKRNPKGLDNYSDNLSVFKTKDGSISLRSSNFKELFHSISGAKKESLEKYIYPSELIRYRNNQTVNALDVCLGMGYNSASIIEALANIHVYLNLWALDVDKNPLRLALKDQTFKSNWSLNTRAFLNRIQTNSHFKNENCEAKVLWGDARRMILELPKGIQYDLIYLDPFSPQKCPELWSEEFLKRLSDKLVHNGRLITYCRSAAVRASMKRAGLNIKTILPRTKDSKDWSYGTIGIKNSLLPNQESKNILWSNLSEMEEDHLKSAAAIPYRDPSGDSTRLEIIKRRTIEQNKSNLKSTSLWKKQWMHTKDY